MTRRRCLTRLLGVLGLTVTGCGKDTKEASDDDPPLPPNRLPPQPPAKPKPGPPPPSKM